MQILALDAGQSGVRTLEIDGNDARAGREFPGVLTHLDVLEQLSQLVMQSLDGRRAEAVAIGSTGLGDDRDVAEIAAALGDQVGTVHLAHDSITSYLGALGDQQGCVVAAGTGSIILGVGPERVHRVDGWGFLLGDFGSGFWIGQQALTAVYQDFDQRGPATALRALAEEEFGELPGMYITVQSDPNRVARIASWAKTVSELATTDEVCADISRRAGEHLANSVLTSLRVSEAEPLIARIGNVFLNSRIAQAFDDAILAALPEATITEPLGTGLTGASLLPSVAADSPLGHLIRRASNANPQR